MNSVKLLSILLLPYLFLTASVSAQDYDDDDPCDWAYLFSWGPDFTLSKYNVGSFYNRNNNETPAVGIGIEKYLNNRWSVVGGLDLGIDNSTLENNGTTDELNITEWGVKAGANYYFKGIKTTVSPYIGGWLNYVNFSESTTFEQGNLTTENEFSASTFGVGLTFGGYVNPWPEGGFSFGACYNIAYFTSPASKVTVTSEGQTNESEGPSRSRFTDCGGQLMVRYSF